MAATLYTAEILRLATEIPHHQRLLSPHASAEKRSPICGSEIALDVRLDEQGRIAALGQQVKACALGQASASLMGRHAIGQSPDEVRHARDVLSDFLDGKRDDPGDWPGLDIFRAAIPHKARHASIRLAFEALSEAADTAAALGRVSI